MSLKQGWWAVPTLQQIKAFGVGPMGRSWTIGKD